MKKIAILAAGAAISIVNTCYANNTQCDWFNPYIGVSGGLTYIPTKGSASSDQNVANKAMPTTYKSMGLFLGNRFHKNFGIEIGYDSNRTADKKHSSTSVSGDANPALTRISHYNIATKNKIENISMQAIGYLNINHNIDLLGIIGIEKAKFTINRVGNKTVTTGAPGFIPVPPSPVDLSLKETYKKTIPVVGAGLQYNKNKFGARIKVLLKKTDSLGKNNNESMVGNSISSSLQLFITV